MEKALHWFRRDLRLADNTALNAAIRRSGEVYTVYVASAWSGTHEWTGPGRQAFLCACLGQLSESIAAVGGRLIHRRGDAVTEVVKLAAELGVDVVYANRDPDPFGREVEKRLSVALERDGRKLSLFKDTALHERDEVLTGAGTSFRVFTPYSRAWLKLPKAVPGGRVTRLAGIPAGVEGGDLPKLASWGLADDGTAIPAAGEAAALERVERFLESRVFGYADARDLPALEATSRISQDLRWGTVSIREVFRRVQERMQGATVDQQRNAQVFIAELCWREFYFQTLWFHPEVLEVEFQEQFRGMPWETDEDRFNRWCEGRTGFPIVDAGMRELRATGFVHNRVRMIVAMFLTKDLHLDWRMGERWFQKRLLDGEIASNNGGWQWSAGTGTDAAPYFRIQNPWTQTGRYDPEGLYIRRWVPELAEVLPRRLAEAPTGGLRLHPDYPLPMLDHARERDRAMDHYKGHLASVKRPA
jgi:deoxyribodipyrimidine photo-lyase